MMVSEGARRYLFSSGPERHYLSEPPSSAQPRFAGCRLEKTELLKLDQECFRELVADADARVVT